MTPTTITTETEAGLQELTDQARTYVEGARSENTRRAYRCGCKHFVDWCALRGLDAMPATQRTVTVYIADCAAASSCSTIGLRATAIAKPHRTAGYPDPCQSEMVRTVLAGVRRAKGTAPTAAKHPLLTEDIHRLVAALPDRLIGQRDRALILVGFAGGFRRSELVALSVEDLEFGHDGLGITLGRSKTDQQGAGRKVGVAYGSDPATCPVRALRSLA